MAQPLESYKVAATTLTAEEKELNLRGLMREMQTVLVAYSGGVDSSYLALIAARELGKNAVCVTGLSPSVSQKQREQAVQIAADFKFNFQIIETDELDSEQSAWLFVSNGVRSVRQRRENSARQVRRLYLKRFPLPQNYFS